MFCLVFTALGLKAQLKIDTSDYHDFDDLNINHYTTKNGLNQNTVRDLNLDSEGFLWITTNLGPSSFDGQKFNSYLTKAHRQNFGRLDNGDLKMEGFKASHGLLVPDSNFTLAKGYWSVADGRVLENFQEYDQSKPDIVTLSTMADGPSGHRYFYGHDLGNLGYIFLYENGIWDTIDQVPKDQRLFALDSGVYSLHPSGKLRLYKNGKWIRTIETGLKEPKVIFSVNPNRAYLISGSNIYKLDDQKAKDQIEIKLWIKNFNISQILSIAEVNPDNRMSPFFIGTNTRGLFMCRNKEIKTITVEGQAPKVNNIYAHVEIGKDSVITGSGYLIHPKTFVNLMKGKRPYTRSLFKDVKGRVWTKYGRANDKKLNIVYYQPKKDLVEHPVNVEGNSNLGYFAEDDNGGLWSIDKTYIYRYSEANNTFERIKKIRTGPKKTSSGRIYFNPFSKKFWFTRGQKVIIWDPKTFEQDTIHGFENVSIRSIYFLSEDISLVMTKNFGIFSTLNNKHNGPLQKDPNHFLTTAHCVVEDDNGYCWISSNNGILQAKREEIVSYIRGIGNSIYYYTYDEDDGIDAIELNGGCVPCGLSLSDGQISFPSLNGLVQFNPDRMQPHLPSAPLNIRISRINKIDTLVSNNPSISAGIRDLEFTVAAPYFGQYANNGFIEYKLDGFDSSWIPIRKDNIISFSNLKYGSYNLLLRRKKGYGLGNFSLVNYPFRVQKFYYEKSWFRVLVLLVLLSILGLILYLREAYSRKQKIELRSIIQTKTRDYRVLNERLQNNLDDLKVSQQALKKVLEDKNRMMGIYTHDIRGPLKHMVDVAQRNEEKYQDLNKEEVKKWFHIFANTANSIYEQTERMFHWISGQNSGTKLEQMEIPLREMIFESTRFFRNQAMNKEIEFINNIEEDIRLFSDPNIIRIAVNNIIDNSIKYTQSGFIEFNSHYVKEQVYLKIKDSGIGMSAERLDEINIGSYVSKPGTENEIGKGFGLNAIRKLLSEIGATIELESRPNEGTTAIIVIPVQQN